MSRDPLEELFGPSEPEEERVERAQEPADVVADAAPIVPAPVAASVVAGAVSQTATGQTPVQAPTVQRSRDDVPTEQVGTRGTQDRPWLPWVIIAGVAAVALAIALIFVNVLGNAGEEEPEPDRPPVPETTTTPPPDEDPVPEETEEPEPPTPTVAPDVDMGETFPMDIGFGIDITVDSSSKLEPNLWYIPATPGNRVVWLTNLDKGFPDSCADMRSTDDNSPWGIEPDESGNWVAVKPERTCAEDPERYNEMWGLMQKLADSARPLEEPSGE